jgi:hypothetical protein
MNSQQVFTKNYESGESSDDANKNGGPGQIRTDDQGIMSPLL